MKGLLGGPTVMISPVTKTSAPLGLTATEVPRLPLVAAWTRAAPLLAAVAAPLATACLPGIGAAAAAAVTVNVNPVIATMAAADSRDQSLTTILLRDAAAGSGASLPNSWAGMARNNLLFRNCLAGRAKRAGRWAGHPSQGLRYDLPTWHPLDAG